MEETPRASWLANVRETWNQAPVPAHVLTYIGLSLLLIVGSISIAYWKLARKADELLASGPFQHAYSYLSAPELLSVGDSISPSELAGDLKRANYTVSISGNSVIAEGPSRFEVGLANERVISIVDLTERRNMWRIELPPQLLTNRPGNGRVKRLVLHYSDLPPVLVQAITSAEDKRFFHHSGVDLVRLLKASYVDLREHRKEQGASTISMQLARALCLDQNKSWKRKLSEILITLHLESKLTKEQIFEAYCNTVYLGSEGTFSIDGFGEAARSFFNKDAQKLSVTEAATLAGLIQRPSFLNPFHSPDRALERRNVVLTQMRDNKFLGEDQYQAAVQAPLGIHRGKSEFNETPYFLDLASIEATKDLDERQPSGASNVFTTLDPRLQRAAEQSISDGMQLVDKALASQHRPAGERPQVALIALDPHTGEVKAICGGRDYAGSQFNRLLAKRPPGSVFKPFVYTAALNTAVVGGSQILTPVSTVLDSPTTFVFANRTYSPHNFKDNFQGMVTFRRALAHSLNTAAVKVGEMVGYEKVAELAHRSGMNEDIRPTPAIALGAYQVTPLEIAGAYTIFANEGVRVQPAFVAAIRNQDGTELYQHAPATRPVLDPRVAFLMVDMLQEVMRSGTAAGVRSMGFTLPAAGKTGTSHDGWFAGFTSRLLCIVWVGFDDYSELGLEGAHSALPIWTEFMMRASRFKQYGDVQQFVPPSGVVRVGIDPQSGQLAAQGCPSMPSYFIDGTQPATVAPCLPPDVEVDFTPDGAVQRINQNPYQP